MSSDTPRTDAQRPQNMGVNRDFARQLERELAEAIRQRDEARDALCEAITLASMGVKKPAADDVDRWRKAAGLVA